MEKRFSSIEQLLSEINMFTVPELREFAREFGVVPRNRKREDLIQSIIKVYNGELSREEPKRPGRPAKSTLRIEQVAPQMAERPQVPLSEVEALTATGILEIMPDGYGFIRTQNYSATQGRDCYLSANIINHMSVKSGDKLKVLLRQFPERIAPTAIFIQEINDDSCNGMHRTPFDTLEACFPNQRIKLETDKHEYSLRALDLIAPIGKGQRGLIVAPPKTGKTMLLKKIAQAVRKNHPEIHLTVLLIDERPEEVTDFKESVDCEVVYSTFDQPPQNHTRIAELVFNNARRRVEQGQDVMILMDSITRLARAYNQTAEQSGRTLTGGLDISALQEPKRMFGAGRNVRNGGSLTILATALIDTGSRMDDIVYEEFKGTGNMEIQLDRKMSERRIFPAIDLNRSSTRREDLLFTPEQLEGSYLIRKMLSREDSLAATEELLELIQTTDNNEETLETLKRIMRAAEARRR